MNRLASHIAAPIPQTKKASPGQVPNSGGGFSFAVDAWTRLERFLVLGSDGGSYYAGERELTLDNAEVVKQAVAMDGVRVVNKVVEISKAGRAPKNDPALLALAIAAKLGDEPARRAAFAALPEVARIGTHLFHFAEFIKALKGGWGRGTTNAFARWYTEMPVEKLAMQAIKYQQRDGWSHRDLLRKSHPKTTDETRKAVFNWMCHGWESVGEGPHPVEALAPIWAFEKAKTTKDVKELCKLITDYRLPHECVPNEMKKHTAVWEAMLPHMGLTALIRNLGKMSSIGMLDTMSENARFVRNKLLSEDNLKAARVHPMSLLVTFRVYSQGHSVKGSLAWSPNQQIVDALDGAFYKSFGFVEHTGKAHMLAIDCSASMTWGSSQIPDMCLNAREAAAAMALVTANIEPECGIFGFSNTISALPISPKMRLDQVIRIIHEQHASATDCALPMLWAMQRRAAVDAFIVYTDSETNTNSVHPHLALKDYRQKSGRNSKLIVCGMVANEFSIAQPSDAGMLDVVGFDTAAPEVISNFVRG